MDLGDVLFDVNKASLKAGARESLAKLSGVLLMLPEVNVRIEGFTDSTGTSERNKVLSAERAKSVFDYLTSQGIDAARLSHAGYGPANPVADNATKEGRAKNRRVELTFAQGPIEPTPGGYTAPEAPPSPAKAPAKKAAAPAKKG
jgi:outer membrane protein OmpA-like peptidoglycan-associated protein